MEIILSLENQPNLASISDVTSVEDLREATAKLAEEGGIPVIASGGVTNMDDLKRLATVADTGVIGAITGRAIYEGTLDVAEAQAYCDSLKN